MGLLCYAAGALSMVLSQSLLPIVIFWAIIGEEVERVLGAGQLRGERFAIGMGDEERRRRDAYQRPPEDVPVVAEASGSSTKKVEPIPSLDSIQILPPMRRTSSRQM
jgi:hypothetical protein